MTALEIPRHEWEGFFDSFSRRHEGWLVTIEVFDEEAGAKVEARELPLQGVSAETGGGREGVISISAGYGAGAHVTHRVYAPVRVRLDHNPEGAEEALEIAAASGTATIVRFRSAMLPEMVDGAL